MWIEKENFKLFLFIDDMIVYVENSRESTTKIKLLELSSNYRKAAGYKIKAKTGLLIHQ